MVPWLRICSLVSLTALAAPAWACGPFLYDNADLDHFSLLEPAILNSSEWTTFLSFSSPPFGQASDREDRSVVQEVIHPDRIPDTSGSVSNLLYDYEPGLDPVSVAANEAWWTDYFLKVRKRQVGADEIQKVLYGPDRPQWLAAPDRQYLEVLAGPADSPAVLKRALAEARNAKNPVLLRHRWVFWAVRALALRNDPATLTVFREFCPGPADDLPLARAQGWAASTEPSGQARDLWVDLLARWPALRAQTFSSLATLDPSAWKGATSSDALVAKYFLDGRDFSPETLAAVASAEHADRGPGTKTETVFYSMAEQVEKEAGVFALFGLVDPNEVSPRGLFTGLIDQAQALVETGVQPATRTWWLVASYLALFDGDPARSASLLDRARALPALNAHQAQQTELLETLLAMDTQKDKEWTTDLQKRVLAAMEWGKSLDGQGHNRGLYHSVVVLVAQKELARGHNPLAVLAFGLIQGGGASPYDVAQDDGFWTTGWTSNNSVNLLMDALMTDDDLALWKTLLHAPDLDPLAAHLASHSFLNDKDLLWWQAHRALRRGQGDRALAFLKALGPDGPSGVFHRRSFSYSLSLDPLDPASGRGMRAVSALTLAGVMSRVEDDARTKPSSRTLLAQGQFWLSLQFSGMPLLFSDPPPVISFVNGNFEYYGYDALDQGHNTAVVGTFPLGQQTQTDAWARRLAAFYKNEFSTLGRARAAFQAVVARHDDPDAEFRALLFLEAMDHDQYEVLADPRYEGLPLADTLRSTCEDFSNFLEGGGDRLPLPSI